MEPLLGEWVAHGQPTARLGTVKNSPGLLGWTKIGPCVCSTKILLELDGLNCVCERNC